MFVAFALCRFIGWLLCLGIGHGLAFYGVEFLLPEVQNPYLVSFMSGGVGDIVGKFFSECLMRYPNG